MIKIGNNDKIGNNEILNRAKQVLANTKDLHEYKTALAICLSDEIGFTLDEAAEFLNCCRKTVVNYRREFRTGQKQRPGLEKPRNGNGSYFTIEEEKEILSKFEDEARAGKINVAADIQAEYENRLGKTVPNSTIYRMLKRHRWRKVAPRPRHPKADREAQEAFKKNAGACSCSKT